MDSDQLGYLTTLELIRVVKMDLEASGYADYDDLGSVADRLILSAYYAEAFGVSPESAYLGIYGALREGGTDSSLVLSNVKASTCKICDMNIYADIGGGGWYLNSELQTAEERHIKFERARLNRYAELISGHKPKLAMLRACLSAHKP